MPGKSEENRGHGRRLGATRSGAERRGPGRSRQRGVRRLQRGGVFALGGRHEGRDQTQYDRHETRAGFGGRNEKFGGNNMKTLIGLYASDRSVLVWWVEG